MLLTRYMYQDPYNPKKSWQVEHSSCGHYYLSEYIELHRVGRRERRRKSDIADIGVFDFPAYDWTPERFKGV